MYYLSLIFIKILDNFITTIKNIMTYREMKIISSIFVIISQFLFYFIIKSVVADNTLLTISIISISAGIGNYLAFILLDKFKKDEIWTNIITSSDETFLKEIAMMLKDNDIPYLLLSSYNRNFEPTLTLKAYTLTKNDSKKIDTFLQTKNNKYLRIVNNKEIIKE